MKKTLLILLPLMLLACSHEETELPLYQRYADSKDLTVAQVKGFQIGDTLKTDVVLLVADDSAAWAELKAEFDIRTSEGVTSWMGNIEQPAQRVKRSVRPAWRAMAVHEERTIAFYRIETEAQRQALMDYQMKAIENEQ
jgi:hypothetical protein